MLKKLTLIFVAFTLIFSMTACGEKKLTGSSDKIADDTIVAVVGEKTDKPVEISAGEVRKLLYVECLVYGVDPANLKDDAKDNFFGIYTTGLSEMNLIQMYCNDNDIKSLPENSEEEFASFMETIQGDEASVEKMKTYSITEEDLKNYYQFCYCQLALTDEIKAEYKDLEGSAEAYYKEHTEDYTQAETEITASHILVEDEATAEEVLKKLEEGADFGEMAKQYSKDGSASNGGVLGTYTESNCNWVEEFKTAAFAMKAGQISEPVKSEFGYHIIYVSDRKEAGTVQTYEEVKQDVQDKLLQDAYTARVEELAEQYGEDIRYEYKEAE